MTICLDLAEKVLKLRTLKCAFLCILNDGFGSWKWWDNVESTGNRYCTLTLKENIVFGSWNTWEQFELNDDNMVHSGAIWNDVLKVGTTEIFFKARTQNDALWCYLKRFIWRWNCWEKFESKEKKWCILMLFETVFWKLELLWKYWKKGNYMVNSGAIWNGVLEVGTAKKLLKTWKLNGSWVSADMI